MADEIYKPEDAELIAEAVNALPALLSVHEEAELLRRYVTAQSKSHALPPIIFIKEDFEETLKSAMLTVWNETAEEGAERTPEGHVDVMVEKIMPLLLTAFTTGAK